MPYNEAEDRVTKSSETFTEIFLRAHQFKQELIGKFNIKPRDAYLEQKIC